MIPGGYHATASLSATRAASESIRLLVWRSNEIEGACMEAYRQLSAAGGACRVPCRVCHPRSPGSIRSRVML